MLKLGAEIVKLLLLGCQLPLAGINELLQLIQGVGRGADAHL